MDNKLQDLKASETVPEDLSSLEKLTESYLSLKKRIYGTNELIMQYNDKLKECERLKTDLDSANKQTRKVTCNYNTTLAKVIKLELQNTEYKKKLESLTNQVNDHKVKAAADQQHIQQLVCKIQDVEGNQTERIMQYDLEKSSLEVRVKELEQELKSVKKSYDTKLRKVEKKMPVENSNKLKMKSVGTNTVLNKDEIIMRKPKVADKGMVTDECYDKNNTRLEEIVEKPTVAEKGVVTDECYKTEIDKSLEEIVKKPEVAEKGVVTDECYNTKQEEVIQKPKVADKCIVTNERFNVRENVYPIYCGKCKILLEPPPHEEICRIMSNSCPKLIGKISSPAKKMPSPLRLPSPDMNTNKIENLSPLITPDKMLNQNGDVGFIPTKLLSPHPTVSLNRGNNFVPTPSLMNQRDCYVGSPINQAANLSAINNNHSEMTTIASTLSIISSLQNKVNTLETKLKRLNKKKKKKQASNSGNNCCCQHGYPIPYMYGGMLNNPMQFGFVDMWQKMMEMNNKKEKKPVKTRKRSDSKIGKYKFSRLKSKKRSEPKRSGSWNIEVVETKIEQNTCLKKPKKRKYRYSSLFSQSDLSLNKIEAENSNTDSDNNSYSNEFNDIVDNKVETNVESKSPLRTETSRSVVKSDNDKKQPIYSAQSTDIDEAEIETVQNYVESTNSMIGETDSGILSDSVESGKLMQLESEVDGFSHSIKRKTMPKVQSKIKNKPCLIKDVKPITSTEYSEKNLLKTVLDIKYKPVETDADAKAQLQLEDPVKIKEDRNVEDASRDNDLVIDKAKPSTLVATSISRKRKINEIQGAKSGRENLLKKIRNLKKNKKAVNSRCPTNCNHLEIPDREDDDSTLEQNNSACNTSVGNIEDHMPKKKPRIVHVRKTTLIEQTNLSSSSLDQSKCLTKDAKVLQVESQGTSNKSDNETATIFEQTIQDYINSSKTGKVDNEHRTKCNDETDEQKPACLDKVKLKAENMESNNADSDTEVPSVKDSKSENTRPREQKNSIHVANVEDYTPKKKSRIAHVPKGTVTEQINSVGNPLERKESLEKIASVVKVESQSPFANGEDKPRTIIPEQLSTQRNDVDLYETSKIVPQETNNNNSSKESTATRLDPMELKAEAFVDNNDEPIFESSLSDTDSPKKPNSIGTEINFNDQSEYNSPAVRSVESSFEQIENIKDEVNVKENFRRMSQVNRNKNYRKKSHCELDVRTSPSESNSTKNLNDSVPNDNVEVDNTDTVQSKEPHSPSKTLTNATNNLANVQERVTEQTDKDIRSIATNFDQQPRPKSSNPLEILHRYIEDNKGMKKGSKSQCKKLLYTRLMTDKFVQKQLQKLASSYWQPHVHWDVLEKLRSTCSARIIAKGIVEFLQAEPESNHILDKSHTPPAPLMTKSQQKLLTLLFDLQESKPTIIECVQACIEYRLFRLNQEIKKSTIESLARMYTVLSRIKKDREKVRIFCCDALYCLGLNATLVLYIVLTCWPEVFPSNETNKGILPKCMAHVILIQEATNYPKLQALKNLISIFYKYPVGMLSTDLLKEMLTALQEKCCCEIESAIVLLAKREGTAWTYKNIIRSALLPMIVNNKFPSMYRAFYLLGILMRVFPVGDANNSVGEIVEQLCDLINSGEGSDEQNEGVVSALLSLSRHKFDEVVRNTLKWRPAEHLRDRTEEQFNGLFNQHNSHFWRTYLQRNKHLLLPHGDRNT